MSQIETTDIQPVVEPAAEEVVEPVDETVNSHLPIFGKFRDIESAQNGYEAAVRKITEQGQQLAELREQIAAITGAQLLPDANVYEGSQGWGADELAEMQALAEQAQSDPRAYLTRQEQLQALEAAAVRAVDQRFVQPPSPASTEQIVNAAKDLAATASPELEANMPLITQEIQANPDLGLAVSTAAMQGDSSSLASLLLIAERTGRERILVEREHELAIRAKKQAQTASGQGPARTTSGNADQEEWAKIVGARPTTEYWRK